jgi:hypothetical protein
MPARVKPPSDEELKIFLGSASDLWSSIIEAIDERQGPLVLEWRPSKAEFGRICLIQHKKRTLLYVTPDKERVWVAIVLGERAYGIAMASSLPAAIKKMFSEAKPYAEGRGIRFQVSSLSDIPLIEKLVEIKSAPK